MVCKSIFDNDKVYFQNIYLYIYIIFLFSLDLCLKPYFWHCSCIAIIYAEEVYRNPLEQILRSSGHFLIELLLEKSSQ